MTDPTVTERGLSEALTDEVLDKADDAAIAAANVGLGFDMDEWFVGYHNAIVAAVVGGVGCDACNHTGVVNAVSGAGAHDVPCPMCREEEHDAAVRERGEDLQTDDGHSGPSVISDVSGSEDKASKPPRVPCETCGGDGQVDITIGGVRGQATYKEPCPTCQESE